MKDAWRLNLSFVSILLVMVLTGGTFASLPNCTESVNCSNVNNSYCVASNQTCQCNNGFHPDENNTTCESNLAVGATCSPDKDWCDEHSTCKNTTADNFKCTCDPNYFQRNDTNGGLICVQDIDVGQTCSIGDECVANAVCVNSTSSPVELKCFCKMDYFERNYTDETICVLKLQPGEVCSSTIDQCTSNLACLKQQGATTWTCGCQSDYELSHDNATNTNSCQSKQPITPTCSDSLQKCGNTKLDNCTVFSSYLHCALRSTCSASVSDVDQISTALIHLSGSLNEICETMENGTTCENGLIKCLSEYMKVAETCSDLEVLDDCISSVNCTQDSNQLGPSVAKNYQSKLLSSLSCDCIADLNTCNTSYTKALENAGTDNNSKCSALTAYIACLLKARCDLGAVDNPLLFPRQLISVRDSDNFQCVISSGTGCEDNLIYCSYSNSRTVSLNDTTIQGKCSAANDLLKCVNAAKCGPYYINSLTPASESAVNRLQSLNCSGIPCGASYTKLSTCQGTYQADTATAGSNATKLCIAQNNLVSCLKDLSCNEKLASSVNSAYTDLQNTPVPSNCTRLTLDGGPTGSACRTQNSLFILTSLILVAVMALCF